MISMFTSKKKKQMKRRILAGILAGILAVSSYPVLAAEESSSVVSDVSTLESSEAEESQDIQEDASQLPAESEQSEESSVQENEESSLPEESPLPEEEGSTVLPEEEETFAAKNILVVGGHKTYMSGYSGGLFKPDKYMTRAEVAVMLYNLMAAKPPVSESAFSDVSLSSWYGKAVNALYQAGVIGGYPDGTFRPSKQITRGEFVKLVTSCFPMQDGAVSFEDVSEDSWVYPYVVSATISGWISGYPDGTFRPGSSIKRCEAVKIMNEALERTGDGFAADRNVQEFSDVPMDHWAFYHIAEAADPVEEEDPETPPETEGEYVKVTATSGLNLRNGPGTDYDSLGILPLGSVLTLLDTSQKPWYKVKTSSGTVGYVHSDYVVSYTPGSGSVTISMSKATICQYETLYLTGTVSPSDAATKWTSSNEAVATVSDGFVYAKAPGTAVITHADYSGTSKATCTVTVTGPEAVRAAYTDPNVVGAGDKFNFVAVTDTNKSAVKFVVTGVASGTYETTSYTTESQSASGLPTNTVRIFKKSVSFSVPGSYSVKVYSKTGSTWSSDYESFSLLVVQDSDPMVTSTASRKASTEAVNIIAQFEGFLPTVYPDNLAGGIPTVGYGYVVPENTTFYNNLTKTEAMAILVDNVNSSYAPSVNSFRSQYNLKMSQCQFDALVSFVYNCGGGTLLNTSGGEPYYGTARVLTNAVKISSFPVNGTVNVSDATVYKSYSTGSGKVGTIKVGGSLTVLAMKQTGYQNKEVWYQVKSGSVTGWARAGDIKVTSGNVSHDLDYVDSITFGNNITQWCSAGGVNYVGLYDRRRSEARLFSYGDYAGCYRGSSGYDFNPGYTVPSWYN